MGRGARLRGRALLCCGTVFLLCCSGSYEPTGVVSLALSSCLVWHPGRSSGWLFSSIGLAHLCSRSCPLPVRGELVGLAPLCVHGVIKSLSPSFMAIVFQSLAWLLCCCCSVAKSVSSTFATPWIAACQGPLSTGFPRLEYWSGLPFPSPGDLPDPGIEPMYPVQNKKFFFFLDDPH